MTVSVHRSEMGLNNVILIRYYSLHLFPHLASLLVTGLIFYDTKVTVMNRVLNATVQRTADHAAPEITLDPLEIVGGTHCFLLFACLLFPISYQHSLSVPLPFR